MIRPHQLAEIDLTILVILATFNWLHTSPIVLKKIALERKCIKKVTAQFIFLESRNVVNFNKTEPGKDENKNYMKHAFERDSTSFCFLHVFYSKISRSEGCEHNTTSSIGQLLFPSLFP
jgi:hypothetical protein